VLGLFTERSAEIVEALTRLETLAAVHPDTRLKLWTQVRPQTRRVHWNRRQSSIRLPRPSHQGDLLYLGLDDHTMYSHSISLAWNVFTTGFVADRALPI
jgi:hypothetical protein